MTMIMGYSYIMQIQLSNTGAKQILPAPFDKSILKMLNLWSFITFLQNSYYIKAGRCPIHLAFIHPGFGRFINILLFGIVNIFFRFTVAVVRSFFNLHKHDIRLIVVGNDIYFGMFKMIVAFQDGVSFGFQVGSGQLLTFIANITGRLLSHCCLVLRYWNLCLFRQLYVSSPPA